MSCVIPTKFSHDCCRSIVDFLLFFCLWWSETYRPQTGIYTWVLLLRVKSRDTLCLYTSYSSHSCLDFSFMSPLCCCNFKKSSQIHLGQWWKDRQRQESLLCGWRTYGGSIYVSLCRVSVHQNVEAGVTEMKEIHVIKYIYFSSG